MKKTFTLLLMLLLSSITFAQVSTWDGTHEPWTHGTGTEADPFLIENAQQLAYLTYRVNNGLDANGGHISNHNLHYKLMVDVNLNGNQSFQWTPIGYWNSNTDYQSFGGHFDGNGHTISGLYINSSANRVGLFGNTDGTTIQDLNVNGNMVTTTGPNAGEIIAYASGTTNIVNCNCTHSGDIRAVNGSVGGIIGNSSGPLCIESCSHDGVISYSGSSSSGCAGGIVGTMFNGAIVNCYNMGGFDANGSCDARGGIVGCIGYTTGETTLLTNCFNTGNILNSTGSHHYAGGIIGQNNGNLSITNCYNMGFVSGDYYTGGIIGFNNSYSTDVSNSYNAGDLYNYNSYNPGGIVGCGNNNNVNCYYLNTCGGNNTYGGQPMSSDAMQSIEFVSILNNGSCSWLHDDQPFTNNGYPMLTMIVKDLTTNNATNITQTHAKLHGSINVLNANILSQGFEYRKIAGGTYQTINISECGNIQYTVSDLLPNTNYQYRTFCTDDVCGTTYGNVQTFTTAAITVTTNNATNITQTQATLKGTVISGDANISAQGFKYKKTTDQEYIVVECNTGQSQLSYSLDGLITNTHYHYRTYATSGNTTIHGELVEFVTLLPTAHTITATASSGGTISPSGNITVYDGESQTFTITPNTNYAIEAVLVDGTSVGAPSTYTFNNVTSDHTISVSFRSLVHHITATTSGTSGTISPAGVIEVMESQSQTFTITPTGESAIQSVLVDGNDVGSVTSYTFQNVTTDHTIKAVFYIPERHQITAGVNGPGTITPDGVISVIDGDSQTFVISPIEQSTLDSVTVDNVNIGAVTTYTFNNVTENHTICGHFTLITTPDLEPWDGMTIQEPFYFNYTYYICSPTELAWVAWETNTIGYTFAYTTIRLMNDLDLGGNQPIPSTWIPIGTESSPFKGSFTGYMKTIKNLYCNNSGNNNVGLFGYIENASIGRTQLRNVNVVGNSNVGGLVGYLKKSNVGYCGVTGRVVGNGSNVGGLVGYVDELDVIGFSNMMYCFAIAEIEANDNAGGLIGYFKKWAYDNNRRNLHSSFSAGFVHSHGISGGLVGFVDLDNALNITNCYSNTTVTGTKCGGLIGGRVGYGSGYYGSLNVNESYVSGSIEEGFGFIAKDANNSGVIATCSNCFFDTQSTGCGDNGLTGVSTKMTNEMTNSIGFGMTSTLWNYTEGLYPQIKTIQETQPEMSNLSVSPIFLQNNENSTEVHSNFQVSTANGVTWSSSDPDVIGINGSNANVNPMMIAKTVTLTASLNGISKQINVTVAGSDTIFVYQPNELRLVAEQCNMGVTYEGKYVKLMNDIEFEYGVPNNMTQIGSYPDHPFMGTLDGNGKVIRNVYIDHPNNEYQGFFGYTKDANLYEVGLENLTISGRNYTGGLVSYAENSYIRDSYVNGGTLFALSYVGGLVGYQSPGTNSVICGCYNTCEVTGNNYLGGLVGYSNQATVRNSYVIAPVNGNGNAVGAIIGRADQVLMYNCYFSIEETGQTQAIGENNLKDGDEGMHSADMKTADFVNKLNRNLVVEVWRSDYANNINNGFPIIKWQPDYNNPCQPPVNLMVNEVGGLYARLSWQGAADNYVIAYGKDGVYNQTITTTENNIRLEGLQLNTDYVWKIKAICGEHETDYVIGQPFKTQGTSVDENDAIIVVVYPNPTNGKMTVEAENLKHITISNLLGQIIYNNNASGNTFEYDFSKYSAGLYLIRIETASGIALKKVSVVR